MKSPVVVAGVGMVPFAKPGASAAYYEMGAEAARRALADADLDYGKVQQAYAGYVYGDSTCGQRALYPVGMTGIPVVNVNNNCSTGSTALFLARQAVESGAADCVMALGFEQMQPGALGSYYNDRPTPFESFDRVCEDLVGQPEVPLAIRYFGGAGMAHMDKYGTRAETFAKIRAKASRHAAMAGKVRAAVLAAQRHVRQQADASERSITGMEQQEHGLDKQVRQANEERVAEARQVPSYTIQYYTAVARAIGIGIATAIAILILGSHLPTWSHIGPQLGLPGSRA